MSHIYIHSHPSVRAFTVTSSTKDPPPFQLDVYPDAKECVVRVRRPLSFEELEELAACAKRAIEDPR